MAGFRQAYSLLKSMKPPTPKQMVKLKQAAMTPQAPFSSTIDNMPIDTTNLIKKPGTINKGVATPNYLKGDPTIRMNSIPTVKIKGKNYRVNKA